MIEPIVTTLDDEEDLAFLNHGLKNKLSLCESCIEQLLEETYEEQNIQKLVLVNQAYEAITYKRIAEELYRRLKIKLNRSL